jgi:biotin carboxyl carrier protein
LHHRSHEIDERIGSEVAGKIVRTYVENGQPVEYGQTLFAIEPARKK